MEVNRVLLDLQNENRNTCWDGEILERQPFLTRRTSDGGKQCWITAFNLGRDDVDAVIERGIEEFGDNGFEWKTYSFDTPADLIERLVEFGFEPSHPESVMVYDLSEGLAPFVATCECRVAKVDSAERIGQYRSVTEAVFHKDFAFTAGQIAAALESGRTSHEAYIAYLGATPAAAARLYTQPSSLFAGLYGGGTLSEFRGRGCYRALIAMRARIAFERGARYLMVDAMPTSRPILERLGFVKVAETTPCLWHPRSG